MKNKRWIVYAVCALVILVSPAVLNRYWTDVLNVIGLYAMLALSLNIILGHCGMFHMGHAAFYAVGAYTTAILNTAYGIPVLWLMPLSGLLAGLFAMVIARPIIHLRGDYLLIVTIGFVEIVRIALINNIFGITGGANGIFGIDRPTVFGLKISTPGQFFYLIWFFVAVTIYLLRKLEHSRFGRALNYIREDDVAAAGSGIDTAHYKLIAFVIGAVWAGFCGTLFAAKMTIIAPESFNLLE
jgi:branched-chain amino acid transport system permease protein